MRLAQLCRIQVLVYTSYVRMEAMFCHRLSVAAGVLASLAVGGLLTGCSASSRVEDVVPSWANSPPPRAQHQDRREQRNSKPALERREQATVPPQPPQPPALEE